MFNFINIWSDPLYNHLTLFRPCSISFNVGKLIKMIRSNHFPFLSFPIHSDYFQSNPIMPNQGWSYLVHNHLYKIKPDHDLFIVILTQSKSIRSIIPCSILSTSNEILFKIIQHHSDPVEFHSMSVRCHLFCVEFEDWPLRWGARVIPYNTDISWLEVCLMPRY